MGPFLMQYTILGKIKAIFLVALLGLSRHIQLFLVVNLKCKSILQI